MPIHKRKTQPNLFVKAKEGCMVREIDETGKPLLSMRFVGYNGDDIITDGVNIPYHVHYINQLKLGMLIPMDLQTAQLAGVSLTNQ